MCLQLEEGKYPIVLPLQLRKKHSTDSKMPQYSVISEKNDYNPNDDEMNVSMQFYHSVCTICTINCTIIYKVSSFII